MFQVHLNVDDVVERRAGRGEDRLEVFEDLAGLTVCLLPPGPRFGAADVPEMKS